MPDAKGLAHETQLIGRTMVTDGARKINPQLDAFSAIGARSAEGGIRAESLDTIRVRTRFLDANDMATVAVEEGGKGLLLQMTA